MFFESLVRASWAWVTLSLCLATVASLRAGDGCAACNELHEAVEESSGFRVISFSNGLKRMGIIRVDFEDLPGMPRDREGELTVSRLMETINGPVASYFEATSYGNSTVEVKASGITDVLRMPDTAESYAQEALLERLTTDARRIASEAGYAIQDYDRVGVVFSSLASLPGSQVRFRAYAGIGGTQSWFHGDFSAKLVAHELGHNYGLGHASSWWVQDEHVDPLHPSGERIEYGNVFDVMGRGDLNPAAHSWLNVSSLAQLGWLPDTAYRTVEEDDTLRLYRFDHQDVDRSRLLGIRIPLSANRAYWLSYRHAFSQLAERLTVVRADEARRTTLLLDMHPGGSVEDAGLPAGKTFYERELGLSAVVLGSGGEGPDAWIDVEVAFLPEVTYKRADISVVEDQGSAVLEVVRSRSSESKSIVQWEVISGTAIVGEDVVAASGTVSWEPDEEGAKQIELKLLPDTKDEPAESFIVRLSEAKGAIVPVRDAVVHIIEPGVPDPTFVGPLLDGRVRDISVQADGELYVVGDFERIDEAFGRGVARVLSSGRVDESFSVGQGTDVVPVYSVTDRPGNRILCGGAFSRYDWESAHGLVRLNRDASLDETFDAKQVTGTVFELVPLPEGGYLAVGNFAGGVARFSESGEKDLTWTTDLPIDSSVTGVVVNHDETFVIAGWFPRVQEEPRWGVLKLDAFGKQAGWLGTCESDRPVLPELQLGENGGIMLTGNFSAYDNVPCRGIAMIDSDGVLDLAFHEALGTGPNGRIDAALRDPDGSWILVGGFDSFDGQVRHGVARLDQAGSVDSWDPGGRLQDQVGWKRLHGTAVALHADGSVLLGFTNEDESKGWLARVAGAISHSPGLLEMESASWEAKHGAEVVLPVFRRRGEEGDVNVRYTIRLTSKEGGVIRANPTGQLSWPNGDTQPKEIHVVAPSDPRVTQIAVFLSDAGGGAQTTSNNEAVIVLEPASPSSLWLYDHFGVAANVASAFDADLDADQDGLSNLLEYALDRNPRQPDRSDNQAYPKVRVSQGGPTGEESLEIEVNLPAALRPDIRYEILMGDGVTEPYTLAYHHGTLNGWIMSDSASPPYVVSVPEGRQTVRFREPMTMTSSSSVRRFMQLRVQLLR